MEMGVDLTPDELEPVAEFQSIVYRVYRRELKIRLDIEVDEQGMICVQAHSLWHGTLFSNMLHAEQMDVYDYLVEWELATWIPIGPEDSELFATDRLRERARAEAQRVFRAAQEEGYTEPLRHEIW